MSETATIDPRIEEAAEPPVGTGDDETATPEAPDTGETEDGDGQEGGQQEGGESAPAEPEAPTGPAPTEAG